MKKLSLLTTLLLVLTIFSVSIVSADPSVESGSVGQTNFVPEQQTSSTDSVGEEVGILANPMGTISCVPTSAGGALCDWRVAAGFKKIVWSHVTVTFEKWNSSTFTWSHVHTTNFDYEINPSKAVIEDQAGIGMLVPGFYRAKLGGTIITQKDGTFVASASNPATFTVE
ncbi:hypothetical protein P0100_19230 [Yersinia pestis]|nr:hypothetical protein [Yersinia pestis]